MTEETQEVPKWLKELEEKRERRLKARLGHEAGAGSPCLTCEEKCPGLDLHFWRKICKNCKCGKENHDVNDDDIYGWAHFQLLGSKPNKAKKIVLPGRKDAVELEWTPKGQSEVVESYLKELPVNLLPIKGSAAAQERKQLLQKQIPLHDIDPSLCHALTENEVKQMNDYIAHVKQHSVGVGHIMKLNELLKNRHSANTQFLSNRTPMQVPQVQNIVLQGVDRSNALPANMQKALKNLSLDEQKLVDVAQDEQIASNTNVRDVSYGVYADDNSSFNPSHGRVTDENVKNMQVPKQPIANQIDYQTSTGIGDIRDIKYPSYTDRPIYNENRWNSGPIRDGHVSHVAPSHESNAYTAQYPNQPINNRIDYQNPINHPEYRGIYYPENEQPPLTSVLDQQANFGGFRGMQYPKNARNEQPPKNQPANFPQFSKNLLINTENVQKPVEFGRVADIYPDMNVNYGTNPLRSLDNVANLANLKSEVRMPHYAPGRFTTPVDQQNPQRIGNVRDLAYSTYDPSSNYDQSSMYNPSWPYNADVAYGTNPANALSSSYDPNLDYSNQNVQRNPRNMSSFDPNPRNLDPNLRNLDPNLRNLDPNMRNLDPNLRNLDLNLRNIDPNWRNLDPNSRNLDPNLLNLDPNLRTLDSNLRNIEPKPRNFDPNSATFDPNSRIVDPTLSGFDPKTNSFEPKNRTWAPNPLRPVNYNPAELNVTEQHLDPTTITVGAISDIEYPTIKTAVQKENHVFDAQGPRKNVQFDLDPQEILPACHKCRKMFDADAIVIGIDHTDALWHADCFKCTGCNQNLADLMYFYDKETCDVYCGRDYAKIRGIPRCHACDELIFVKEYCLAENSTFHVKHFCCFECDEPLAGQNYVMEDSQPLCLPCFEKVKAEKCNACLKVIKPDEQGANLNGVHFHADDACFACKMCRKPLLGSKLLLKNSNLYCSAPCFAADK